MSTIKNLIKSERQQIFVSAVVVVGIITSAFFVFTTFKLNSFYIPPEITKLVVIPATPVEWVTELPVRLLIPAIGVDASVQYVGLAPEGNGEMAVPSNFTDVGWYQDGVRPGMRGSAVIAGHFNGKGVKEAVFYDLAKLAVGDEVVIMSAEKVEDIFQVVRVETFYHDSPTTEVFLSNKDKARLNLITCGGDWLPTEKLYNQRTVVFTESVLDVE